MSSVAKAYAKALYEAATEGKAPDESREFCDQLESQLENFASLVATSKDAQTALFGPITTTKEKVNLVTEFGRMVNASPLASKFLALLANKGRLNLVPKMKDSFAQVRLAAEGGVHGQLVSAEPLPSEEVNAIADVFGRKLGRRVAFQVAHDPALLAGVKVTLNGVTYDGTLRSQLHQLRDRFITGMPS